MIQLLLGINDRKFSEFLRYWKIFKKNRQRNLKVHFVFRTILQIVKDGFFTENDEEIN